mgnify:CR=1 FL=1
MLQELESSTVEILRGLGRADPGLLAKLTQVEDWRRIAAMELERRATLFIQSLDEATVQAIADGRINLPELCRTVLAESSQHTE